jgi:hypothetical protein
MSILLRGFGRTLSESCAKRLLADPRIDHLAERRIKRLMNS